MTGTPRESPSARLERLRHFDAAWGNRVAGIDEVGRGAGAGPLVVAGALMDATQILPEQWKELADLNDSKKVPARARERLAAQLRMCCESHIVVSVSAAHIDAHGMAASLHGAFAAVAHSLAQFAPDVILVDGSPIPGSVPSHRAAPRLDAQSAVVAAAAILAKHSRDEWMREHAHAMEPHMGYDRHVGYLTAAHRQALRTHGPGRFTRRSFTHRLLGDLP